MKKLTSIILAVIFILSCFTVTAFAENAINNKFAPNLLKAIESSTEGGAYIEISHHEQDLEKEKDYVDATARLVQKIEKITKYETLRFSAGKLYLGAPYSAMKSIAEIDTVDYISFANVDVGSNKAPEEKIDTSLNTVLDRAYPDTEITIGVTLAYSPEMYLGFTEDDFETSHDYVMAKRKAHAEYFSKKNQDYFDEMSKSVDITLHYLSLYYPSIFVTTTASEVMNICSLNIVDEVYYVSAEPIEEPTESIEDSYKYSFEFEKWMYDNTSSHIKKYDPTIDKERFGKYFDYDELYYHYGEYKGFPDWALITAKVDISEPWEMMYYLRIEDRIIKSWRPGQEEFYYDLFIYDAKDDTFYPIDKADLSRYEGFVKALDDVNYKTIKAGDVDEDDSVTIIDSTLIQKMVAKEIIKLDIVNRGAADYDGDKEITVIDATLIQKYLARLIMLDNEQRWLPM